MNILLGSLIRWTRNGGGNRRHRPGGQCQRWDRRNLLRIRTKHCRSYQWVICLVKSWNCLLFNIKTWAFLIYPQTWWLSSTRLRKTVFPTPSLGRWLLPKGCLQARCYLVVSGGTWWYLEEKLRKLKPRIGNQATLLVHTHRNVGPSPPRDNQVLLTVYEW